MQYIHSFLVWSFHMCIVHNRAAWLNKIKLKSGFGLVRLNLILMMNICAAFQSDARGTVFIYTWVNFNLSGLVCSRSCSTKKLYVCSEFGSLKAAFINATCQPSSQTYYYIIFLKYFFINYYFFYFPVKYNNSIKKNHQFVIFILQ